MTHHDLMAQLRAHEAKIGIIGLGYVGLPLALAFLQAQFPVMGFDTDEEKIALLKAGKAIFIISMPPASDPCGHVLPRRTTFPSSGRCRVLSSVSLHPSPATESQI